MARRFVHGNEVWEAHVHGPFQLGADTSNPNEGWTLEFRSITHRGKVAPKVTIFNERRSFISDDDLVKALQKALGSGLQSVSSPEESLPSNG